MLKLLTLTFSTPNPSGVSGGSFEMGRKCPILNTGNSWLNPFNNRHSNLTHWLSLVNEKNHLCSPGTDTLFQKVIMIFHHPRIVRKMELPKLEMEKTYWITQTASLEAKCFIDQTRFCLTELPMSEAMLIPPFSKGDYSAFQQMLLSQCISWCSVFPSFS